MRTRILDWIGAAAIVATTLLLIGEGLIDRALVRHPELTREEILRCLFPEPVAPELASRWSSSWSSSPSLAFLWRSSFPPFRPLAKRLAGRSA